MTTIRKEMTMTLQEFFQKHENSNLSDIPWEDFPDELKEAFWKFIKRWFEETDMDDLREISGFDDMSLEDLLKIGEI